MAALKLYNLARMTTASVGSGTITLGSAVPGFLSFSTAGVQDQDEIAYGIQDGANSEIGTGIYTAAGTTLTRVVDASTNGGSQISLSGTAQVMILGRAQDAVPEVKWNGGRLTFTTATPVLGANTTAQSSILWTPYKNDHLSLVDGNGNFLTSHAAEGSVAAGVASGLAISLDTSNALSGKIYDVFGFVLNGVSRLGYGPAWTSNTARSAGTAIARNQGIWMNSGSLTARMDSTHTQALSANAARYLGSFYATANGQSGMNFSAGASGGGNNILGLYNADNQVPIYAASRDTVTTYNLGQTAWRAPNGNANNAINYLDGLGDVNVRADFMLQGVISTFGAGGFLCGINRDSTSAAPATCGILYWSAGASGNDYAQGTSVITQAFLPSLGYHTINAVERGFNSTTVTMYGSGFGDSEQHQQLSVGLMM